VDYPNSLTDPQWEVIRPLLEYRNSPACWSGGARRRRWIRATSDQPGARSTAARAIAAVDSMFRHFRRARFEQIFGDPGADALFAEAVL